VSGFGVEHLPYGAILPLGGWTDADAAAAGVAEHLGGRPVLSTRLGSDAVLLPLLVAAGLLGDDPDLAAALLAPTLNPLIELGAPAWRELRARLQDVLPDGADHARARVPLGRCAQVVPMRITDYVDFYASLEHVENFGRIFRPGKPAVQDNWRHLPVAYHGRASTVIVSNTPVRRPSGMLGPGVFGPTQALDIECEVGFVCGPGVVGPIPIDEADDRLFGVALVNDWSARDMQFFEFQPLGPFLGKSFATGMSAWVTPLEALAGARVPPRPQDPEPADYLRARSPWSLDLSLEISINGQTVSRPNASTLYWTPSQMLAHMTVNGATLSTGDLFATGTVSGPEPGSLAELWEGQRWLADGDEVVLRGRAADVELGEARGTVQPG
jgi:fumarylacetoacetase